MNSSLWTRLWTAGSTAFSSSITRVLVLDQYHFVTVIKSTNILNTAYIFIFYFLAFYLTKFPIIHADRCFDPTLVSELWERDILIAYLIWNKMLMELGCLIHFCESVQVLVHLFQWINSTKYNVVLKVFGYFNPNNHIVSLNVCQKCFFFF